MECTPPCQRESPRLYAQHTPRDPCHESNNHSMGNQRSTPASHTSWQHRSATNVSSPKAGAVLAEDLKRQDKIRREEGDRMNPEEEREEQYKEEDKKKG